MGETFVFEEAGEALRRSAFFGWCFFFSLIPVPFFLRGCEAAEPKRRRTLPERLVCIQPALQGAPVLRLLRNVAPVLHSWRVSRMILADKNF